jgi:hypothetical protein
MPLTRQANVAKAATARRVKNKPMGRWAQEDPTNVLKKMAEAQA